MNNMLNSKMDNKNIGLLKNLYWLRQELDVYCLITANTNSIKKKCGGQTFWGFLQRSCVDLITLNICKIYEYEKQYELNSIEGVLKHITSAQLSALGSLHIEKFMRKYDCLNKNELSTLSLTVAEFKRKYHNELKGFVTYRDKRVAHSEFGFDPDGLPSYDIMEQLFNFGRDFYMLVSKAFTGVVPADLDKDRKVKVGLKKMLEKLGVEDIKTEME